KIICKRRLTIASSSVRQSYSTIRQTATWRRTIAAPRSTSTGSKTDDDNTIAASKSKFGANHAAERLGLGFARHVAAGLVARRMVEDRRLADRDHPDPDLRHSHRAPGWLRFHWRHQGRNLRHDCRFGDWRLHLRRNRQAYSRAAQYRGSRNLCHLRPLGSRL